MFRSAYAKALAPFVLTILGVVIHGLFSNEFDMAELEIAVTGIAAATVVYLVPNEPETGQTPVVPPGMQR